MECSTIHSLNAFANLVFLRITDDDFYKSYEDPPFPDSLYTLPRLSLPRLEDMRIVCTAINSDDIHPDGYLPFFVGAKAELPALRRLHLYEACISDYSDGIMGQFLEAHGRGLRELHLTTFFMEELDRIHELAPNLTTLVCNHSPHEFADVYQGGLEHPLIEYLSFSGLCDFTETIQHIDPAKLPKLREVRYMDARWDIDYTSHRENHVNEAGKILEDIEMALSLAEKGIPCSDANGKPFGGLLSMARQRRGKEDISNNDIAAIQG
ncbi:hypothetical protein PUNSTDRAFT_133634 [Punctularia strigosozonata HHB-11173 SS5]|uniref:uncharacterized protein n=1 Tax=Punctularia strigosozonata (strain HHB-11173) TaxID=741275 RepID=UPI0004417983|nr:uncharacterized protein PUNSTDRAFT_133634 [Punctularia strigosozonata HHB-11173 SS5]EIN09862.1 hypothetical protein PUNSTDRAFT_133634 [Punctularia strigosozonata HHB-11173 SS5]